MPFIPTENCLQVEMVFIQDGQYVENVYHVQRGDVWDAATAATVLAAFKSWWDTNLKAKVHAAVSLFEIVGTDLTSSSSGRYLYTTGLPEAGTNTGTPLPNNVTVAVKWATLHRGRSFQGRTYHIGLPEQDVSGNRLTSGAQAGYITAYNTLPSTVHTADASSNLVVLSRFTNHAPRSAGVTTPIASANINQVVDSQRRRLPERGR